MKLVAILRGGRCIGAFLVSTSIDAADLREKIALDDVAAPSARPRFAFRTESLETQAELDPDRWLDYSVQLTTPKEAPKASAPTKGRPTT